MKQHADAATATSQIERACRHYLQQVRAVLPLDSLAVVLLDPGEDTGKVVFSWRASPTDIILEDSSTLEAHTQPGPQSVLNIPLYGNQGVMGGLLLHTSAPAGFSQLHCRLARDLASRLAMQLENAQLHQRLQTASQELMLLDEVSHIVFSSADLYGVFHDVARAIYKMVEHDSASLSWLDPNGYDIHTVKSGTAPSKTAGFETATPIAYGNEVLASLKLQRVQRPFKASERGLLAVAGNQIAPVVQSARYQYSPSSPSNSPRSRGGSAPLPPQGSHNSTDRRLHSEVDLAHALCTPLTAIKGYASSLLQTNVEWPPEVQREFLQTIDQAADRLGEVIRELVLPAEPGPGPIKCRWALTELRDLFDRVASDLQDQVPNVRVVSRCRPEVPLVTIDRHLIERAIRYLIDWCLDTDGQGVTLLLEARPGSDGPTISLAVDKSHYPGQWAVSLTLPTCDTDLRVIACRNILEAHGTTLHRDTTRRGSASFWFTVPHPVNQAQGDE